MNTEIISAFIGAGATIFAALVGIYGKNISALIKRKELGYPDIKGNWKATWYLDGKDDAYLEDTIVINRIRGLRIYGEGMNTGKGNYPIMGKYSKNLILNFIYESGENYISLSGVIALKINPLGDRCEGKWYGYTKEDELTGGRVIWER